MRHLFQCWDEVAERVKQATQILLFLDYDGTLTPITIRPDMAELPPRASELLREISQHNLFKLAIVSGRSLSDIKRLVGLENIAYVGNHGLEIEYPLSYSQGRSPKPITFVHPIAEEFRPWLRRLEQRLTERLRSVDGVLIENKGLTLSLHYRLAEETALEYIERLFVEAIEAEQATVELQITRGKKVLELRPALGWNKGKAIEWLLKVYGTAGSLPVFAGDDITDEDGFGVLRRVGGVSILVGEGSFSSTADYHLDSPEQLHHWLERLLETPQ